MTTYSLELTALDKTVKGTRKDARGGGAVSGSILPRPAVGAPAATGEHPRFLLRSADLAALKAKAATPRGQTMLKNLDQPEAWSRSSRAVDQVRHHRQCIRDFHDLVVARQTTTV